METKENLHGGHRQRLLNKFLASRELLADHELLECLLFLVIPRQDTNPLAHRLIKAFGGLRGVFTASKKELTAIKGVGDKTAEMLMLVGGIFERSFKQVVAPPRLNTPEKIKNLLAPEFKGQPNESSVLVFLDKDYKRIFQLSYGDMKKLEVAIDLNEIVNAFANLNPAYLILAHNHTVGSCFPSKSDDKTTKRIEILCQVHGVTLLEHAIFMGEQGFYSYREEKRLNAIRNQIDLDKLLDLGGDINE